MTKQVGNVDKILGQTKEVANIECICVSFDSLFITLDVMLEVKGTTSITIWDQVSVCFKITSRRGLSYLLLVVYINIIVSFVKNLLL